MSWLQSGHHVSLVNLVTFPLTLPLYCFLSGEQPDPTFSYTNTVSGIEVFWSEHTTVDQWVILCPALEGLIPSGRGFSIQKQLIGYGSEYYL